MSDPFHSSTIAKISAAIVKAQAAIRAAGKSGDNKFDKYTYAKLEDFFDAAKPVMAANGLALLVSVTSCEALPDRPTKNGGLEHAVRVMLKGDLIHESGEMLTVTGCGEGQDRADKALYKAITGGKKYLLASLFSIPTTDDPEADETVGQAKPKVASVTGEVVKKKPRWEPAQQTEIGLIFKEIYELGGKTGEADVAKMRQEMAYDQPSDVLDAARNLLENWRLLDTENKETP